jgi:hypothetical protein
MNAFTRRAPLTNSETSWLELVINNQWRCGRERTVGAVRAWREVQRTTGIGCGRLPAARKAGGDCGGGVERHYQDQLVLMPMTA